MIKLVSFDMFLTLADLDACYAPFWKRLLRREIDPEEMPELGRVLRDGYFAEYLGLSEREEFTTMREVFAHGIAHVFEVYGLPYDPWEGADIFNEEHDNTPFYPEVPEVLSWVKERYKVAVSTDADRSMVTRLLTRIPHDYAFISEELGCYKKDRQGRFFRAVLEQTGLAPEEILHVGDGASDILGASAAGIQTCLLQRYEPYYPGWHDCTPDYVIRELKELKTLLAE